jgi:hypothetical protein
LTLLTLKKAVAFKEARLNQTATTERVKAAETHLANIGATAFGLIGLQGSPLAPPVVGAARSELKLTKSRLTRAWLILGLRLAGEPVKSPELAASDDITITALEALGAIGGNSALLLAPDREAA